MIMGNNVITNIKTVEANQHSATPTTLLRANAPINRNKYFIPLSHNPPSSKRTLKLVMKRGTVCSIFKLKVLGKPE